MAGMAAEISNELLNDPEEYKAQMTKLAEAALNEHQLIAASQFAVWRDLFHLLAKLAQDAAIADKIMKMTLDAAFEKIVADAEAAGLTKEQIDARLDEGLDVRNDKALNGVAALLGVGGTLAVKFRTVFDIMAQMVVNYCSEATDEAFIATASDAIKAARALANGDVDEMQQHMNMGGEPGATGELRLERPDVLKGRKKPTLN